MQPYLSHTLVALSALTALAAPHVVAAQGYGPTPRVVSVSSTGSGNAEETITSGQSQTSLDHAGPSLKVTAWFPAGYTSGAQVVFNSDTFSGLMRQESSTIVRSGSRILGWVQRYSCYFGYASGTCLVQTERRTHLRTRHVGWHSVQIR
jgi:hypothetical protein